MMRVLGVLAILSFLVLAGVAPMQVAAQGGGPYEKKDPSGDVGVTAAGQRAPASLPSAALSAYLDLTGITIEDRDEETIVLTLTNSAGFKAIPSGSTSSIGFYGIDHEVLFKVPGRGGAPTPMTLLISSREFRFQNQTQFEPDPAIASIALCIGEAQEYYGWCRYSAGQRPLWRIDAGKLSIDVPKVLLTSGGYDGDQPGAGNLPPRLFVGDALSDMYVTAAARFFGGFAGEVEPTIADRLPDNGMLDPFALTYASATSDLRVSWTQTGIVAGEENAVAIQVDNLASNKRIINFTATITPLKGAAWTSSITPSVALAAGKATNITLRVRPPALGEEARAFARVNVRAQVLTESDTVGIGNGWLAASQPLDGKRNTYILHGDTFGFTPVSQTGDVIGFGHGFLSRAETEPGFDERPFAMDFGSNAGQGVSWETEVFSDEFPNPVRLRKEQPVAAKVQFESPVAMPAQVSVQVRFGDLLLGQANKDVQLEMGKTTVEVAVPVTAPIDVLRPDNGTLNVRYVLSSNDPRAYAVLFLVAHPTALKIVPKVSTLALPVDREFPAVAAEAPFKVSLSPTEDLEAFVNPGRVQVFEFDLRNEDAVPVRVAVEAENVSGDWKVEVQPAARYSLAMNQSVHLGVLVHAAETAKEGSELRVKIVAREPDSGLALSGAWIRVLATRGIDIENETFEARGEDVDKIDKPPAKESPGVPLLLILASLAAVGRVEWRRRRCG